MKTVKYFIQFVLILLLFFIFKILGLRFASYVSSKLVAFIGPIFRSKNIIKSNLLKGLPNLDQDEINKISKKMWGNYGRILA